ncbi:hypothetical protein GCM10022246_08060 [Pedobacter ginsengiterrae]|uniref:Uncharacterized protein n=1 Tax=Pedobacter ginsengiterrae TaxID=871696 RepID=A0ABP7NYW3_9SPHI
MTGNIGVGVVDNVMCNIPNIWIGSDQMKEHAQNLIYFFVVRKGTVDSVMTDVKADKC